jgi:hypothetical protein
LREWNLTVGKKPKRVNAQIALARPKMLIEWVRGQPGRAGTLSELETTADMFRAISQQQTRGS